MEEIWKAIPGFEGHYEVSNAGRVKSLDRRSIGGSRIRGRVMALGLSRAGYLRVSFKTDRRVKTFFVHRLVLLAFIGPCPKGMETCHNDGDSSNNRLSNLRWDTHAGNNMDKRAHGTHSCGEDRPTAILKERDVIEIRRRCKSGEKYAAVGKDFGVHDSTIGNIYRRRHWKHV